MTDYIWNYYTLYYVYTLLVYIMTIIRSLYITDFDKVVGLDVDYIDNWTPFMDIRILFRTVSELFKLNGSY